jgi:tetratricopeptide (TPR) repeat protein
LGSLFGEEPTNVPVDPARETDLATTASSERLPQVSAAVLRTRIQQEQDPARRLDLTRRLVALLVSGGRFDEAVAVATTADATKDPLLAYFKGVALLGTGENLPARDLFTSLLESKVTVPGIRSDQIELGLARALRGGNDPAAALEALARITPDSPVAEDAILERGADLLALGRTGESLDLIRNFSPGTDEGKAAAAYLKALALWRSGNIADARKLFAVVPPATPWTTSASTLGTALCLSASARHQQGIDLLEKRLESADETPLLEEQFRLLDHLYTAAATPDTNLLKKWSGDTTKPIRGRLASFYQATGELRLRHHDKADSLLEAFIKSHPDDPLSDQARLLLASSKLQQGKVSEVMTSAADRPSAPAPLRARLAYLRGLAAASAGRTGEAKEAFESAGVLDPSLGGDALFNRTVLIAKEGRGSLDLSEEARRIVKLRDGVTSPEMEFQIALDLARRGQASGLSMLQTLAENTSDPSLKGRARLAAAELNMRSGRGDAANRDLAKAVRENSGEPEREEYLDVFLKDTGRKSDDAAVITAAHAFLKAHPDSRFGLEVRLKLAEALLSSGDVQGARIEFEQLAFSGSGTDLGRRALFLAAQSAARAMDPASIDDSLMLLERVASTGGGDQLVWQARLQQGALKNAQNLPLEALAIYDRIIASSDPDPELRAAALMAKADTLHQLAGRDPARDREALQVWGQISTEGTMPLRWRNQALCKSGMVLEKLGEGDAALAAYYEAFKNPRTTDPEQQWHDKAAFDAARLLEARKQWNDAVALYGQIISEGGPRADEAKARLSKLKLENFLWEN